MKNNKLLAAISRILFALVLSSCAQVVRLNPGLSSPSIVPGTPLASSGSSPAAPTTASTATSAGLPDTSGSPGLLSPQYYSPLQNAQYVSKDATIILRYGPVLNQQNAADLQVSVQGSVSGSHTGQTILADDHKTIIFKPSQPFTPGEQVQVNIGSLRIDSKTAYRPLAYTFTVAINQQTGTVTSASVPSGPPQSAFPGDLTLPKDIPHYTVSKTSPDTGEGYIFLAPFYWGKSTVGSYLLILDNQGQIVYYQSVANDLAAFDFKELPNGQLSFYDQKDSTIDVMNSNYQTVSTYQAQNGYNADLHDSLILPTGYAFLMSYDTETVDMSKVVQGGKNNAAVTGLVIQEIDPSKNVIFEWRSWDHFSFTDSTSSLTDQQIDLVHGNGIALTSDGNLILSSRNLSEITKIDLQTGNIIWRLGGKANMFKFTNDQGFAFQHNIAELPNGDITLFDNHGTDQNPLASRGVEYKIDEAHKTVTKVWEFTPTPPMFTDYMGDTQRLPDGNTFMGWGNSYTASGFVYGSIIEITPSNQTVFELALDQPYVSYRAFRAPWQGAPLTPPALAFKQDASGLTLGYSWNGATNVASWRVYGGNSPQSLSQVDRQAKNGFETQSHLTNLPQGECYFQAAALDKSGKELSRSLVISTDTTNCQH